jgi:hypothetical protein
MPHLLMVVGEGGGLQAVGAHMNVWVPVCVIVLSFWLHSRNTVRACVCLYLLSTWVCVCVCVCGTVHAFPCVCVCECLLTFVVCERVTMRVC